MKKLLLLAGLLASVGYAQKPAYFHLDFAVKELDGEKVVSIRNYKTSVEANGNGSCSIRTGDKIPILSGSATTYLDVGVNIDCRGAIVRDDQIAMQVNAEISTVASETRPPIVHQAKWGAMISVHLGKSTVIFSSDGASGKRQTQLELTVTPIT